MTILHTEGPVALIFVEVSDSSLDHDRKTKLPLYARFGVPEVWIVDLSGSAVEVYRDDPTEGRYASSVRMTQGALTPARIPEVTIDMANPPGLNAGAARQSRRENLLRAGGLSSLISTGWRNRAAASASPA